MSVFVKKSTDAGAPVLTGAVGGAIALFDFLLVTTMGWTKAFVNAANSVAAYKQPAGTNGLYLRVDASTAAYLRLTGYETMTDVNTGTGAFPTSAQASGGLYQQLHSTPSTPVQWRFYSNGKIFYLFVAHENAYWNPIVFGDIVSYKPGDVFGTILMAATGVQYYSNAFPSLVSAFGSSLAGHFLARTSSQGGTAAVCGKISDYVRSNAATSMGNGGVSYPSAVEGGLLMGPVWITEPSVGVRGLLPGAWNPLHSLPLAHNDTFGGVATLNGRTFEVQTVTGTSGSASQVFMETSDTWGEP